MMGRVNLGHEGVGYIDMNVEKEMVITRPENLVSKKGTGGQAIKVTANYFKLNLKNDWTIYQYRVDFTPDIEDTRMKKAVLRRERTQIGGNLFDGTMIFTVNRIRVTELATKLDNGDVIQIQFKEIGTVSRTDQRMLQIYNLILRRAMGGLKLSLLGRNYYDSAAAVSRDKEFPRISSESSFLPFPLNSMCFS